MAYTQIVTIATDEHHTLQEFRASVGAQWTFLSDPGRIVQQDLDIQEYTDPDNDPMIPHTLVLKPGLVVHSIYNGYWFWGARRSTSCWRDLRAATSEIRPDWDLSTPGLRERGRGRPVAVPRLGPARRSSRRRQHRARRRDVMAVGSPRSAACSRTLASRPIYRLDASAGATTRSRRHCARPSAHRSLDRRNLHGSGDPGAMLAGASADWQMVLPTARRSATSATRCKPTTATCSRSNPAVCVTVSPRSWPASRAARTSTPASTSRTSTRIETAEPRLDWLNKGCSSASPAVGPRGVVYETYLVG